MQGFDHLNTVEQKTTGLATPLGFIYKVKKTEKFCFRHSMSHGGGRLLPTDKISVVRLSPEARRHSICHELFLTSRGIVNRLSCEMFKY